MNKKWKRIVGVLNRLAAGSDLADMRGLQRDDDYFYATDRMILVKIHKRHFGWHHPKARPVHYKILNLKLLAAEPNVKLRLKVSELEDAIKTDGINYVYFENHTDHLFKTPLLKRLVKILRALEVIDAFVDNISYGSMRLRIGDHITIIFMGTMCYRWEKSYNEIKTVLLHER